MSSSLTFSWNRADAKDPDYELALYLDARVTWVSAVQGNDGALYCFTAPRIDSCVQLFRLDQTAHVAELELAKLCDRHDAVGIYNGRFVRYPLLRPPLPWPPNEDLSDLLDHGWTERDIRQVQTMPDPTIKIHDRLRGAAGRLISMPSFHQAKAEVRRQWEVLPAKNRPQLPIARSLKAAPPEHFDAKLVREDVAAFFKLFDKFCDEWQLLGLTTWELPDVAGPLLAPALATAQSLQQGELRIRVPWHFPLVAEHGLGPVLQDEHDRQVAEHGLDDADSWESYGRLLQVYHWENVFFNRYARAQRVKRFVTQLEPVLGEILGLTRDRVQTLRKWLHALQSGKRTSLRGLR